MSNNKANEIPGDISTRFLCDIIESMRAAYKTRNFSYLPGLLEELQYRAYRMENAIDKMGGWDGVKSLEERRTQLKQELKELEKKKRKLEADNESANGRDEGRADNQSSHDNQSG